MTTSTAHEARTTVLRAARAKESDHKRQRVLTAIEAMEAAGRRSPSPPLQLRRVCRDGSCTAGASENRSRPHDGARATTGRHHPRPLAPTRSEAPQPACGPTWRSPARRSAACAPSATSSFSACDYNSAPRSKGRTDPADRTRRRSRDRQPPARGRARRPRRRGGHRPPPRPRARRRARRRARELAADHRRPESQPVKMVEHPALSTPSRHRALHA